MKYSSCIECGSEVKRKGNKYCSSKCFAKRNISRNKSVKPSCEICSKETKRNNSKFCSRECAIMGKKSKYLDSWLSGEVKGIRGTFDTSRYIRNFVIERDGERCCICGWAEVNPHTQKIPIRLDHIDGNWSNNSPDNLRILCPNCDSLTSTYCALNKGRGRPKKS